MKQILVGFLILTNYFGFAEELEKKSISKGEKVTKDTIQVENIRIISH